ncbi:hypothetical protein PENSPDRAFT_289851 [Peniophora sp. CONT]|nr:hypothetical protein PENSPDRAFT_289851 [Peniophora sp. CONT]
MQVESPVKRIRLNGNEAPGDATTTAAYAGASSGNLSLPTSALLHKQMHSRSLIRRLPTELLLVIFSIVAIDAKPLLRVAGHYPVRMCDVPWLVIPSVCRWWRRTADLCPELWTVINFFTQESTDKLLDQSGGHLLDLVYCTGPSPNVSSDAAAYFHAIDKHPLLRAKSVKFVSEELSNEDRETVVAWERLFASSRVLTHILSNPGPQVVSLDLTYNLDFEEMSELVEPRPAPDIDVCHKTMSSSDYPRLQHIRLHNWISITSDDLFVRLPLSSLTLSDGVMFYSLTEFLDMLARLPSLQSLIIYDGDDSLFRDSISDLNAISDALLRHSRNPGSVVLPNLRLLKLTIARRDSTVTCAIS